MSKKKTYYHIDQKLQRRPGKGRTALVSLLALLLLFGGLYIFALTQSPVLITDSPEAAKAEEEQLVSSNQNFVKIERLNLLVPFNAGDTEEALESGAWWRYAERGDPENGGNFILSAHRFKLGATPNQTKERSPFYHVEKIQKDDTIDVYYNGQWYSYQVAEKTSVPKNATEIEDPSDEAKLTLYTCSLKGSADGRVVLVATPVARPDTASSGEDDDGGNPLL